MAKCLICEKAADDLSSLCPECGKLLNENVSRRLQPELSGYRMNDLADRLIRDVESASPATKQSISEIASNDSLLHFMEHCHEYLKLKSPTTHRFLLSVLKAVLENSPSPRVMLIRLLEFPAVVGMLRHESDSIKMQLYDYEQELQRELTKSVSKKLTARKLKRRQLRLQYELIALLIFAGLSAIAALLTSLAQIIPPLAGVIVVGALALGLLVIKLSRYSSLDANLKTNPHLSYQIDLLDIPDSYVDNIREQLKKIQPLS